MATGGALDATGGGGGVHVAVGGGAYEAVGAGYGYIGGGGAAGALALATGAFDAPVLDERPAHATTTDTHTKSTRRITPEDSAGTAWKLRVEA